MIRGLGELDKRHKGSSLPKKTRLVLENNVYPTLLSQTFPFGVGCSYQVEVFQPLCRYLTLRNHKLILEKRKNL